jgi:hypothetical protein
VQVKNKLHPSGVKEVGRKLCASNVFKHWKTDELKIPLFRVVLELGLSRASKKNSIVAEGGQS